MILNAFSSLAFISPNAPGSLPFAGLFLLFGCFPPPCLQAIQCLHFKKYLFICLPVLVSVAACRIFRCCMWTLSFCLWDLVPQPGIELGSPELGAQSLSHWTSSEISSVYFRVRRTSFLTILTCTNCSPNSSCAFCLRPATSSSYRQPDLQNLRVCVTPGPEPGGNGSCFFCIITLPKCADLFKECSVQWVNWNNNPEGFFLISKNS